MGTEGHSTSNHLRTQLCLDIARNPGPELIIEIAAFVRERSTKINPLLRSARPVSRAGAATELSENRAPMTADSLSRLRRAKTNCSVAFYLVLLIKSPLSVSVSHDT